MKEFTLGITGTCSNNRGYSGAVLTPTDLKTGSRSKIGSLLVLLIFGLAMFMPVIINAQNPSLRGVAPVNNPTGGFDIDADLYANFRQPSTATDFGDWIYDPALYPGAGRGVLTLQGIPIDPLVTRHSIDLTGNADSDGFTEGSKFNMSPEDWVIEAHSNPGKDDMQNVMIHFDYDASGDLWFIMAGDRMETNGTSYLDFELFQKTVALDGDGGYTSEGTDGGRTVGDLVISIEYSNGGVRPQVFVYRWESVGFKQGVEQFDYVEYSTFPSGTVYAASNIEGPISVPYGAFGSTTYAQYAFVEAAVNLFEIIPNIDRCKSIATVLVKTKASDALNAALKDVIEPIQIEVNPAPVPTISNLVACESEAGSGSASFNLNEGVTDEDEGTITFHTSQEFADEGTNAIENPETYISSGETIFVRSYNALTTCFGTAQFTLTVNPAPSLTNQTDEFCFDEQTDKLLSDYNTALGAGAEDDVDWYSNSARTISATSTGGALAVGDHTFYATVTNSDDCSADGTLVITINAAPSLTNQTDEFCFDEQTDKLLSDYNTALGAGAGDDVDWYSNSARTISATSTGGALAVGDHTFYATVTNSDGCDTDGTLVITINAAPSLTNQTDEFCFDEQTDKLLSDYNTALGAGAGDDVDWYSNSARTISATSTGGALAVGDHTFYATVTSGENCTSDGTLVITINAAPSLTNQTDEFCFDEQTDKLLSDYNTALGAGAGDDVDWYSNSARTISATSTGGALAVGDHTFYATVTNSDGCDTDGTLVITINAAPSLTNQTDEFCFDEQTDKLLSDYNTALGAGAGDDVDWYSNSARTISATSTGGALAVGDHTFYATVTNSDGCDTDGTLVITINAAPSLTNQTDEFCFDEQTDKLLSDYNTALGAGAGDDVDWYSDSDRTVSVTSTGGALTVGDHTFYATVTNSDDCDTDGTLVITIDPLPVVTILDPPSDPVCSSDDIITAGLQFLATPTGGTWSGDVDSDGNFVPDVTESTQTIRYDYTDGNGCSGFDEITFEYEVQPQDDTFEATYCISDVGAGIDLSTYLPAGATNITYSGPDVDINGLFTGSAVDVYVINITYRLASNICTLGISVIITLQDCLVCETAFAKKADDATSYCFITESPIGFNQDVLNSERWGWTNYISLSDFTLENSYTQTLTLYAAAGQCDISKGTAVGEVVMVYNSGSDVLVVTYEMYDDPNNIGYILNGAHLYVGNAPYPSKKKGKTYEYTVAPGQYPFNSNGNMAPTNMVEFTIGDVDQDFYIIAHADVCTSSTAEFMDQLWEEAQFEIVSLGRNNDSMIYTSDPNISTKTSTSSTSLAESSEPLFSIAPVPFRDVLNIGYLFDYTSDVTIQIFDLNGRLLATYKDTAVNSESISTFSVDFRTKAGQIYIVRMTTASEVYSAKIIADR